MKPGFPFLAVCLVGSIQAGCGGVYVGRESAARLPVDDGAEQHRIIGDAKIEAVADNLRTFGLIGPIVPFIPFWYSGEDKNDFRIFVTFTPDPADDLSFDPRQVVLESEQGAVVPAGSFNGPFVEDDDLASIKRKNKAGPVLIDKKLSIHLIFPVKPLPPGERFTVVLKGLYRSGQPIEAPTLKFKKQIFLGITYHAGFFCLHCGPFIDSKWVINR